MISLKPAHATPQAISLVLGLCFAAVLIFCAATPARAQSAGCTTLAGGGGNTTIPTGTVVNTTVNVTVDAGETITVTVTGNPNSVRIGTNPGNVRLFSGPGNQTVTVTLPAGITGITISGQAGGGGPTQVNFTCTSPTPATTGSGSTTQTQTGSTPEETSASTEAANTAINNARLSTTAADLPSADNYYTPRRSVAFINSQIADSGRAIRNIQTTQTKLIESFMPDYERKSEAAQSKAYDAYGSFKEDEGEEFFGGWRSYANDPFEPAESTLTTGGSYISPRNWGIRSHAAFMNEVLQEAEAAGIKNQLIQLMTKQSEAFRAREQLYQDLRAATARAAIRQRLTGARHQFMHVSGESFQIDLSSDQLFRAATLGLDDSAAAPADLPPLTIAGMPVNIWLRGRGTVFDRQKRAGSDGWAAHVLSGIAFQLADQIVAGAYGSYLTGESDVKATGTEVVSRQMGGGAYAQIQVVDTLSVGLSFSKETGEQDIKTTAASGTADTDLWTVSGSLSGSYFVNPVVLTPSLSVSYAESQRDGYTDSTGTAIPGSRSRDTTIGSGLTVSRSFEYEDGWIRRATPRLNATLNYFAREKDTLRLSATEIIDRDNWGANVGAGVTLTTSGSSRLSFDAGVIGIGQDTLGYTGQLQLEIGF
ncbi:MAG: autotransporter outer membrane beta-barrel domain-containing protein [Alphaproteobacteria bacterium]|nr:autotransporter outer membrane beta-barrel domain-containing protein [Alphaproteobacteria bacterium]